MYAHEDGLIFFPLAFDEGEMFQTSTFLTERHQAEVAIIGRHVYLFANFDKAFFLQAVGNHILDTNYFQIPLLGKFHQLWQTGHCSILIHNLHEGTSRVETCHVTEVDGGFGMSAAAQHTIVLCIEGIYMTRASEGFWLGCRICEGLDGLCAVVSTYTSGATLKFIDGNGKGCAQY